VRSVSWPGAAGDGGTTPHSTHMVVGATADGVAAGGQVTAASVGFSASGLPPPCSVATVGSARAVSVASVPLPSRMALSSSVGCLVVQLMHAPKRSGRRCAIAGTGSMRSTPGSCKSNWLASCSSVIAIEATSAQEDNPLTHRRAVQRRHAVWIGAERRAAACWGSDRIDLYKKQLRNFEAAIPPFEPLSSPRH
jgi:hypothetical protein